MIKSIYWLHCTSQNYITQEPYYITKCDPARENQSYVHIKYLPYFWISNFNNFISNHRSLINFSPFMQLFLGNLLQFTDFPNLNPFFAWFSNTLYNGPENPLYLIIRTRYFQKLCIKLFNIDQGTHFLLRLTTTVIANQLSNLKQWKTDLIGCK